MTKRRLQRTEGLATVQARSAPSPMALHLAAAAVALLAAALAWASRGNLNVDGVSYLDLASRLVAGDVQGFVQGYWSPAYPALLAAIIAVTGVSGSAAISATHALNLVIAVAVVVVIWREARRSNATVWGVLALTAFMMSSARTIRIDAVTPDLLLLLAMTCLGIEVLRPEGWRAWRLGVLAGLAFLIKTSIWPWLMVASVLGLVVLRRQPARRADMLKAIALAALPVALWTAAVSLEEHRVTLGSTGRLGACWYLFSCDGRTPDSHRGEHQRYQDWQLAPGYEARVAVLEETQWSYAPWSDPSSWQQGIVSQERIQPTLVHFVIYVAKQVGLVIGLWMIGLLLLVLLPVLFLTRDAPRLRDTVRAPAGMLMSLGILGILQFTAVHAEPRLVAPFVMLFALGWLAWRMQGTARIPMLPLALGGLVVAIAIGSWHLIDQSMVTASARMRTVQLEQGHPPFLAPHRIAVLGHALPMLPDVYRARARVVAQVMSPDPATLLAWPSQAQTAMAARLAALGATQLWISRGREGFRVAPIPQARRPVAP